MSLYDRIVDSNLLIRRITLVAAHIVPEASVQEEGPFCQLDLFADPEEEQRKQAASESLRREKRRQQALLAIKKKYGKNAIVKGMNLEEGATAMDRNRQIGGHKA